MDYSHDNITERMKNLRENVNEIATFGTKKQLSSFLELLSQYEQIYHKDRSNAYEHTRSVYYEYMAKNAYDYTNQLKKILEVIQMPIQNLTNEKEMDYIDLSLLSRVLIKPVPLHNAMDRISLSGDITFEVFNDPETNEERPAIACSFLGASQSSPIPIEDLETAMQKVVVSGKGERIEDEPIISNHINNLVNDMVTDMIHHRNLMILTSNEESHVYGGGMGIIHHIESEKDIGTFEQVDFHFNQPSESFLYIKDIFLLGATKENIFNNPAQYSFRYYDVPTNKLLNFKITNAEDYVEESVGEFSMFVGHYHDVKISDIASDDPILTPIDFAIQTKGAMDNIEKEDLFYSESYEPYLENRLTIIRSSQSHLEEARLADEFSDISFE